MPSPSNPKSSFTKRSHAWFRHFSSSEALLIISVMVIASCGLAYELIAGALASYVLGDSVMQFSTIIGSYLFAMGIGSHFSKYVPEDRLLQRFVEIEVLVGLIGGLSAIFLFIAFAWLPKFQALLYMLVFIIGALVGMEIPLVMRLLHAQKHSFREVISKVLTFDYLGALVVSLLFPLVLAPKLGLARSAVLFGLLNVFVAGWVAWYFQYFNNVSLSADSAGNNKKNQQRGDVKSSLVIKKQLLTKVIVAFIILLMAMVYADNLVKISEQKRFRAPIVFATSSPYQRLVVTERNGRYQLFLNGNLQFSTRDEYRYHEALVHPAMQFMQEKTSTMRPSLRVLVLGGGDGMAVREVLKYDNISAITLVDLDKKMTDVFAHEPRFAALNKDSLVNEKVTIINQDAYQWVQEYDGAPFDVVMIDLPDPSQYSLAKLYSVSMYQLVNKHLVNDGVLVVQSTSPYYAPKSFWSINKTLQAADMKTTPYHAYVPSFGEWGFIIATNSPEIFIAPQQYQVPMRFLTPEVSNSMFVFSVDMMPPKEIKANTIDKQPLVRYYQDDWSDE